MTDSASNENTQVTVPIEDGGPSRLEQSVLMLLVVAVAALAFGWPTRHGQFLSGDDRRFALEHVFVNHPSVEHAWQLLTILHGDLYQPVPMLSFQLNYALAGPDPAGRYPVSPSLFHLTNIALHALNACLVFIVASRLARRRRVGLLVGLMFACHPFALEPVAWVSGRMILLATTFSLATLAICLRRPADGRGSWPILAGLSWLFALGSKVFPTVPVATALCDQRVNGHVARRAWITYAVLLALGLGATCFAARSSGAIGLMELTEAETATSAPVRMLLAWRYYVENYFWPSWLSSWSPPAKNVDFLSSAAIIALAEVAVFLAAMGCAWRRNRSAFLGLCLFAILLAPFLAATTARRLLTADRYMYLPITGLHLAAAAVLAQVSDWLRRRTPGAVGTLFVAAPMAVVLVAWVSYAWRLSPCWRDDVAAAQRAVDVYPAEPDVWAELAKAHLGASNADTALAVVATARERWPDYPRLALNAGQAFWMKGDWQSAEAELRVAAERMPKHPLAQYYYALCLEKLGRVEDARSRYRAILNRTADFLPAALALARNCRDAGDGQGAIAAYEQAIAINPYDRDSLFNLALLWLQMQRPQRAEKPLRQILELEEHDWPARINLAAALAQQGRYEDAINLYDSSPAGSNPPVTAQVNRAALLASLGRAIEAEQEYQRVLATQPGSRDAAVGLCELLLQQRRVVELPGLWLAYQQAAGATEESFAYLAWAYALSGRSAEAQRAAAAIPSSPSERQFADWALAFDALRSGRLDEMQRLIGPAVRPSKPPARLGEQARFIQAAIETLSSEVRDSPAGIYALARAMAYDGGNGVETLPMLLERIEAAPNASPWNEATRELIRAFSADPPTAGASAATQSSEGQTWQP